MRRIAHDDKTTVKGRRHGITPNILKKEIAKPCKVKAPLRSVNQEIYRKPIYTKLLKTSGQHSIVSDKENHLVTQDVTRIFDKKTRSTVVSNDLSHYKFTRDNDLKKTLSHMEEKFTSSCEELQAAEEELVELRVALSDARRTIEILRMENARQAEKIKFLTIKKQKNDQSIKRYNVNPDLEVVQMNQEVSSVEHGSSKNLQRLVSELKGEKMALNLALENSKANESKIVLENNRLKMIIEEERKEWDQMQKDLLVAVKVANDFKIEAQKEMLKLSERITELQKRRQSAAFTVSQGSAITLYEKNFQSWEDKAWQRLMLGCERGSRRNTLLRWCQEAVVKFSHVEITNFSSSWTDGKALCSLLASFYPDKLSIDKISTLKAEECLELALSVGESMGVEVKVNVADFRKEDRPEWSLIMRYILNLYYIISDGSRC
uniref:Cytospin-A n=1 Tax=Onchocerca volvulus TaxID=6282 RepID=A0A8R1TZ88_ONCVO